jgi:hypothetical protein
MVSAGNAPAMASEQMAEGRLTSKRLINAVKMLIPRLRFFISVNIAELTRI